MSRTEVHFSELSAANSCKLRWQLQYKERLTPVVLEERITVGTLVHKAMQMYLTATFNKGAGDVVQGLEDLATRAIRGKLAELKDKGQVFDLDDLADDLETVALMQEAEQAEEAMVQRALAITLRLATFFNEKYEVVAINGQPAVEFEMRMPIRRPGRKTLDYVGTLDVLCRSKETGLVLLGDFKIRGTMTSIVGDLLHSQTALYQYALDKVYGIETHGSVIFQALNAEPKAPKLTAKNIPAKNKIITTLEIYQASMVACGLDPWDPDYADVLRDIQNRRWVEDNVVPRKSSGAEIQNTYAEVLLPGLRDLEALDKLKGDRGILVGYACKTCSFFPLCEAKLAGYDRDYIKQTQFKVKED